MIFVMFFALICFLFAGNMAYAQELDESVSPEQPAIDSVEPVETPPDQMDYALTELKRVQAELAEALAQIKAEMNIVSATGRQPDPGEAFGILILPLIFVFMVMGVAGFSLIWRSLFPRRTEWSGEIARRMPVGSFFFGLGAIIVTLFIVAAFGNAGGAGGIVAVLLLLLFALFLVTFKIAAMVDWVGDMIDASSSGIRHALYGSSGLMLLLLIPFLGWIVLFGFACIGIGAALMSYIPTRATSALNRPGSPAAPESEVENRE